MYYKVKKAFATNAKDDVVIMNKRQAEHLLLAEFIEPFTPDDSTSNKKTEKAVT